MSFPLKFQKLSLTTSIYEPSPAGTGNNEPQLSANANTPTTILIYGWMGATQRPLGRYTSKYNNLYPQARIITVTSTLSDLPGFKSLVSSTTLEQRARAPATAVLADPAASPRLLVHIFSNGGGMGLAATSRQYQTITGSPIPAQVIILDSAPGGDKFSNEWQKWVAAILVGLPSNPMIRFPAQLIVSLLVYLLLGVPPLFGVENAATKARRDLNDEKLLSSDAKRLYIYSKNDKLIGWKDVEQHASDAVDKRFKVERLDFAESGHVRHAKTDPERYWAAVGKAWESSP